MTLKHEEAISLTGSGSSWKGYLIITEADNNKVGTFYFQHWTAQATQETR